MPRVRLYVMKASALQMSGGRNIKNYYRVNMHTYKLFWISFSLMMQVTKILADDPYGRAVHDVILLIFLLFLH